MTNHRTGKRSMLDQLLNGPRSSRWLRALPLALASCNEVEPPSAQPASGSTFPLAISARSESQAAVPGVEISTSKGILGVTDTNGNVRITLHGAEGDKVALTVKCPSQYASPDEPLRVGLRQLGDGKTSARFEVECFSLVHQVVVGLRAENGANLPIFRLKKLVGRTDDAGIAHVLLEASANEQVALTLDTSSNRSLLPQNPTLDFVTRDSEELVLLSHKFTVKQPPPKRVTPRNVPRHL